jgi:hypothetical protein
MRAFLCAAAAAVGLAIVAYLVLAPVQKTVDQASNIEPFACDCDNFAIGSHKLT